jgi:two-component system, OmpR family, sensor kinase
MIPRLGLRRRLELSVIGAVAVALIVLLTAFNVVLRQRLDAEANNALFSRASAELAALNVTGGGLTVPEVPDAAAPDAQTWVFASRRILEQPRADAITERAAARLAAAGARGTSNVPATDTRLYAVPVITGGRRLGTVVAQVSLAPYRSTAGTALVGSLVLGVLILLVVALAAHVLISRSLGQVTRMTEQAQAWSVADSGRRFDLGPPRDEFSRLAATLDALLDRVASSLRHEQRFSAEVSHELRTPLASLIAEAQLALRHPRSPDEHRAGHERVLASAQQMARTLDTLVAASRVELGAPRGTGDATRAAHAAVRDCAALAHTRGVTVTVADPEDPIRIGVDDHVAERVLAPLIENGCRYGTSSVRVEIGRRDGAVLFRVRDDGAGIPEDDHEKIFEPGWRSEEATAVNALGAGLGLALARRLARAAGGDVRVAGNGRGGDFAARLPAA